MKVVATILDYGANEGATSWYSFDISEVTGNGEIQATVKEKGVDVQKTIATVTTAEGEVTVTPTDGALSAYGYTVSVVEDSNGKATLKPYKHPSDILKVKGMKLSNYRRFANLVCIDSYVYTAKIEAELFDDVDHDGVFTPEVDHQSANGLRHYILKSNPGSDIEHCIEELEEF